MAATRPGDAVYSRHDIEAMLADLNGSVTGHASLSRWAERADVRLARVNGGPNLAIVRLHGTDEHARAVVLMLLEGTWERAI